MFKKVFLGLIALIVVSMAASITAMASERLVRIDGSSTVYPISEAVAEEFHKAERSAIKVTVGISGTGGGFKKFCRGETDISNASRPISAREIEACRAGGVEYIEIPIAYDGIAVVTHAKNAWVKSLTVADLKKIWEPAAEGKIMRWNQVRAEWPDLPMRLYGPGTDSGTFDSFTEAAVGRAKASRGDFTSSEDDNVLVLGIARDRNSLGYFGIAYYEANRDILRLIPVVNPKTGKEVLPTDKAIMTGDYHPLSRPLFIYINRKSLDKPYVKRFVDFYLRNAAKLIGEVGYVPLSEKAYERVRERVAKKKTGAVLGGKSAVGVTIEELLR